MVVVVTPNRSHVPIGIRALEAGRHVVVDKPIAMDIPEAETLLDAVERSGRIRPSTRTGAEMVTS